MVRIALRNVASIVCLLMAFVASPASAQAVDPSLWMLELAQEANGGPSALDQPLSQFIFPGSHMSGSFAIPDFDVTDPFNAPPLACDACISPADLDILSTPGLDVLIGYLVAPLAKTQKRTTYEQLQDGARAFDLRFFRATAGDVARSPELVAGQFYIHRTFAGASSTAVFSDIATFLNTPGHQQEIILLNFSQMYEGSGEMNTASLETIFNQLLTTVGAFRFAPKSLGDGVTLTQLAAQGTQVVVSYNGSTPLANSTISNLVWPPIATRFFGSPDVNVGGNGSYPKADTWNTEERLLNWTRALADKRPNANARYQMYLNMGPDGADFPDMASRSLVCNTVEVVNDIQNIVDPIQLISNMLAIKPPPTNSDPTEWAQLKDLLVDFVRDAVTGAVTAAAIEEGLDLAGVCPAVNNDWDRFRSLEDVAAFTNPKVLPALVGLQRSQVNIILADYYTTAFTAEAKRLNQGAARLSVTVRNVAELECHDCLLPTAPDYYPEVVFRPNGNVAPGTWHDWPYYPNDHATLDPGHYSQFGGPWLEKSGRNINPSWRAMRSVAPTTPFVDVHIRIWDQDDNLCIDPFWCGADNASKLNGSSTVAGFRQPVWQSGTPLVGNFTAWSAGATGTWVFDSSRMTYNVDVCQWSLIPGQPATTKLCGYAGFVGNTAPGAYLAQGQLSANLLEGTRVDVVGGGFDNDPTLNADGDPIGRLASWEWDCAYTGVPAEFEPNRSCTNAEPYYRPDWPVPTPTGLRFYVTDGPANRVLAFRVTDMGGLTSPIATLPYSVTNDPPAFLRDAGGVPQYTLVQDGNAQRIISTATFTDRGGEDGPFTCQWWDGPVGSGTLLTASVIVEDQGIAYGEDIFGDDFTTSQHKCTGTVDVAYGAHVIYFRVLDKDGASSVPALGYAKAITLVSNVTLAAGLASPVLSNINSPVGGNYTTAWTGALEDGYVAAQSGVPTGDDQRSQMFATIAGPGKLTFWWKISGDQYDELAFTVDPGTPGAVGRSRSLFTSTVGWQQETVDILAGDHTLSWNFKNGYLGATNLGRGWVRDVVLTPVVITVSAPLVPGVWNELYPDTTFTQSGGTNPATWAVTSGVLPNGLTLSPAGILTGTPTQAGEFPVTITATDSLGFFGSGPFTLSISPPAIALSATVFPDGTTGTVYPNTTITLNSGTAPATFAVTAGALPPGLTLSSAGTVSGTPTWPGTFAFTVTATDANGFTGARAFTVTVAPGPTAVVTTVANSGAGSLRDVLNAAASGTVITFDASLAGQTIALTSQLNVAKNFAIDASALPGGITLSGEDIQRVFVVATSRHAVLKGLTLTRGYAFSVNASGGCVFSSGTVWLIDSTVTGCVAPAGTGAGGGIASTGVLVLTNTTVSGNTAGSNGGGIYSAGSSARAILIHSTVSGNSSANGGGIYVSSGGALSLDNNVVAGNTSGGTGADIDLDVSGSIPTVTTQGANLIGDNSTVATVFPAGPLVGTLAAPLDAKLAPLGNYGGSTKTMALLAGSPAVNAAFVTADSPAFDQRGVARPGGAQNDIGAVEGVTIPPVTELTQNGNFGGGTTNWNLYATNGSGADPSYLVSNTDGGVFQFYRVAPPPGTSNQAVVFQGTGQPVVAGGPVEATFDLGNSTTAKKRISVLIHDGDFSDLSVCTFYLEPGAALATYRMRTHTTKAWTNATISFYAASAGNEGGGYYRLDNVSVQFTPQTGSPTRTECVDPAAPLTGGGASGNLITNGDFGAGLAPWGTFGQIASQVTSGVFQFFKLAGAPSGVVLQGTGAAVPNDQSLQTTLQLGNSSGRRQRVTVLVHDGNFSDLAACTFWLAPGQPLSNYALRTYATKAWTNATVSVYPATVGTSPTAEWLLLDNVTLAHTTAAVLGAECYEPGSMPPPAPPVQPDARSVTASPFGAAPMATSPVASDAPAPDAPSSDAFEPTAAATSEDWLGDGFVQNGESSPLGLMPSWVTSGDGGVHTLLRVAPIDLTAGWDAPFVFRSWLSAFDARAEVQVSVDGVHWETTYVVDSSDTWMPVAVDLSAYAGQSVLVRFAFFTISSPDGPPQIWRIDVEDPN